MTAADDLVSLSECCGCDMLTRQGRLNISADRVLRAWRSYGLGSESFYVAMVNLDEANRVLRGPAPDPCGCSCHSERVR